MYTARAIGREIPRPASGRVLFALCSLLATCFALAPASPARAVGDAPPAAAPKDNKDKFTLVYKAQVGQTSKGKGTGTLHFTAPDGSKHTLELKEVGKSTYTKVAPNGDITYEQVSESSDSTLDGEKQDDDEKPDTDTITIRPNGLLVSYASSSGEKDKVKFGARLYNATTIIYPDRPVGVGDKWSQDFKGNDDIGTRAGHADYEITAAQKVGDTDAVQIKWTYAETGTNAITSKGTISVEKVSGDKLSAEYTMDNVPLGPAGQEVMASGSVAEQRTDGGPLPGAKNVAAIDKKPEPKKEKTIDEVVKDYEKLPGLLTLYRKKESSKETIYAEIKEDQLGKLLLLQATASTGDAEDMIAGDPISDTLFKFTRSQEDKILITVPNWYYRADPKSPMGKAVKRSFADAYLQVFKIEAKQPDRKSLLIDISDFFRSDFAQITQALNGGGFSLPGMPGGGAYNMDREKTYIQTLKNFPDNLVVSTQYHFNRSPRSTGGSALADPRSLPFVVVYNLFALPNDENYQPTNGYRPRAADPRVGYFTTEYVDFDDDNKEDQTVRYIIRWDLRKKDPSAAVSEPVKPIVFWIDNAIPVEYRDAVRKGILNWNKAFEKVGFKDAIQVKQMPDDADWDHADMRYNVVRWVVTPDDSPRNGVAIALFRTNPLTGQILNASVSVDASWTRYGKLQRRELIDPAVSFAKGAAMDADLLLSGKGPLPAGIQHRIYGGDPRYCEIGEGLREKAWFGDMALNMLAPEADSAAREKAYTDELVVETVTHEMGHIMGLAHNFIASTELTLDQLKDPQIVKEQGISASVMDYNNFNISALKAKGVDYYSQTVGTYDCWAIDYGYHELAPAEESSRLKMIASQSNMPGHAFQSDVQAFVGIDPRVVQYDMSADPLAYWEQMLLLSKRLMLNLDTRLPKQGDSYWEFTRNFNGLLGTYARAAGVASRYVGGIELNRNHRGDPMERPTTVPIDVVKQRKALALLNTYVFSPTAFAFPERYYTKFTTDPYGFSFSQDFPVEDQIAGIQRTALTRLFSGSVLRRISNSEFKRGGDPKRALTLPTLFDSVSGNVWAELATRQNVPTLRRQLQRTYVDTMVDMAIRGGVPDDARMLAWDQLRIIKKRLTAMRTVPTLDEYTRVHYTDSLAKVERALDARLTIGGQQAGLPTNLLQLLLGGSDSEGKTPEADGPH